MIRSFNRTLFTTTEELPKATVKLIVFRNSKYSDYCDEGREVEYTGLTSWDIIEGGAEADEIEQHLSDDNKDEFREYLVLHFNDDTTATFRNSHCSLFIR